jgi:hypothetical protein
MQERNKKKKYLQASCLEQWKLFTPFVISTDGFIGQEVGGLLKHPSLYLTNKLE